MLYHNVLKSWCHAPLTQLPTALWSPPRCWWEAGWGLASPQSENMSCWLEIMTFQDQEIPFNLQPRNVASKVTQALLGEAATKVGQGGKPQKGAWTYKILCMTIIANSVPWTKPMWHFRTADPFLDLTWPNTFGWWLQIRLAQAQCHGGVDVVGRCCQFTWPSCKVLLLGAKIRSLHVKTNLSTLWRLPKLPCIPAWMSLACWDLEQLPRDQSTGPVANKDEEEDGSDERHPRPARTQEQRKTGVERIDQIEQLRVEHFRSVLWLSCRRTLPSCSWQCLRWSPKPSPLASVSSCPTCSDI